MTKKLKYYWIFSMFTCYTLLILIIDDTADKFAFLSTAATLLTGYWIGIGVPDEHKKFSWWKI